MIRRISVNPRLPRSQCRLLRLAIMLLIALTQPYSHLPELPLIETVVAPLLFQQSIARPLFDHAVVFQDRDQVEFVHRAKLRMMTGVVLSRCNFSQYIVD